MGLIELTFSIKLGMFALPSLPKSLMRLLSFEGKGNLTGLPTRFMHLPHSGQHPTVPTYYEMISVGEGNERPQAVSQRLHSRIWSINDCQHLALPNKYIRAPWQSPPQRFLVSSCVQICENGLLHASRKKLPIPMDVLVNPCCHLGA